MERLVTLAVLTVVAIGIALLLQRRRPDRPSAPSYRAPVQLDPADFTGARSGSSDQPLVVLFGSTTCDSCPVTWATIERVIDGGGHPASAVTVVRIDVQDDPDLHRRYRIDGVPTTIVADAEGVVLEVFFGPLTAGQLTDALALAGVECGPEGS